MRAFVHSQIEYRNLLESLVQPGTRWLDMGCGRTIVPEWFSDSLPFQKKLIERCEVAEGCDPADERPHLAGLPKYVGNCEKLPYPNSYFNLVTANMVVEHVSDPSSFAAEVNRILAVGGRFVLHTPNLLYLPILAGSLLPKEIVRSVAALLDGRDGADIFPTHYRMNTRSAISHLPGFRVAELHCVETAPVLKKIPLANVVEAVLIRSARHPRLEGLRADWLGVLEKTSESGTASMQSAH
jgi:SAM-dependent methyltransferase